MRAIALLISAMLLAGCADFRKFNRFFLTRCAEDGPRPEQELDLFLRPVDVPGYLEKLRVAADGFSLETIAEVSYESRSWPILLARRSPPVGDRSLLVVAGIHGNEIAGSLAAPDLLLDVSAHPEIYDGLQLDLIAPANPVGLAHGSRYNAQGCDVNRDFGAFETVEARAVRDVVEATDPDLIVSLHEGPHDGFFVIATRSTPSSYGEAIAAALRSGGIELATHSNLGSELGAPGVMQEGWFVTGAKALFRIRSLGAYAHGRSTPMLTTEGPWGSPDVAARVRAQVLAVRAAASELRARPGRSPS